MKSIMSVIITAVVSIACFGLAITNSASQDTDAMVYETTTETTTSSLETTTTTTASTTVSTTTKSTTNASTTETTETSTTTSTSESKTNDTIETVAEKLAKVIMDSPVKTVQTEHVDPTEPTKAETPTEKVETIVETVEPTQIETETETKTETTPETEAETTESAEPETNCTEANICPVTGYELYYSAAYSVDSSPLTKRMGVKYFGGHKETYYDEKVLPGPGLNIPGRHVADDGTIRDENGYICVASDLSYLARGSIVLTSRGPAKVYDTGCAWGTIDIYVNW